MIGSMKKQESIESFRIVGTHQSGGLSSEPLMMVPGGSTPIETSVSLSIFDHGKHGCTNAT